MAEETENKAEEEEATTSEETAEESGGGRKKLIIIVAAAVLVLGGAGAGFVLMSGGEEVSGELAEGQEPIGDHPLEQAANPAATSFDVSAGGEEEVEKPKVKQVMGTIYALETFVVNIRDGERDRYLKLKAELELSKDDVADEIEQRLPQVRDIVLSLLGSKSFDEIRSIEGKDLLREELLRRVNALLVSGKARNVFFTEFVVQ